MRNIFPYVDGQTLILFILSDDGDGRVPGPWRFHLPGSGAAAPFPIHQASGDNAGAHLLFSSMLVTNDVALLTFVPFSLTVLRLAGQESRAVPVVVLQTVAANLGSMFTPHRQSPESVSLRSIAYVFDPFSPPDASLTPCYPCS